VREALLVVFTLMVTWLVLFGLGVAILRWRLARNNRVSPAVRSAAPLRWLWWPTLAARLHRRLRAAVALIHLAPSRKVHDPASLSVDELRRDLEHQAVEIDGHLVVAWHHPRSHRRGLLANLARQVDEVEHLAPPSPPEVLERIAGQLDLLDEAKAELAEIERASGLVDVDQLLADTRTAAASAPPPSEPLSLAERRTGRAPR